MICPNPKCQSSLSTCENTKDRGDDIVRRRRCNVCGAIYHTVEIPQAEFTAVAMYRQLAQVSITIQGARIEEQQQAEATAYSVPVQPVEIVRRRRSRREIA